MLPLLNQVRIRWPVILFLCRTTLIHWYLNNKEINCTWCPVYFQEVCGGVCVCLTFIKWALSFSCFSGNGPDITHLSRLQPLPRFLLFLSLPPLSAPLSVSMISALLSPCDFLFLPFHVFICPLLSVWSAFFPTLTYLTLSHHPSFTVCSSHPEFFLYFLISQNFFIPPPLLPICFLNDYTFSSAFPSLSFSHLFYILFSHSVYLSVKL